MFKVEYNPGYYDKQGNYIKYDISYYCNKNKIIHGSKNEFLNCKNCNK